MKKSILFLMTAAMLSFTACSDKKDKNDHEDDDDIDLTMQEGADGVELNAIGGYGKEVQADGAIALTALVADIAKADGYHGKVSGTVVSSCQNKGCWMTLDCGNGETMMVSFKDYGFFVPMDMTGKKVVIEGVASINTVSIDDQKHLASDEGLGQEAIDAINSEKTELGFIADGVLVI